MTTAGPTPQYIREGSITLQLAAQTDAWIAVTLDTNGKAAIAAATDADNIIGITEDGGITNDYRCVRPLNDDGTFVLTASVAFAIGDRCYPATGGKWTNVGNGPGLFIAKSATAADGELFEAIRVVASSSTNMRVIPKTVNANLAVSEAGAEISNTGAAGAVRVVLPVGVAGMRYHFAVGAAQSFTVGAQGGDVVSLPDTGVPGAANKGLVNAGTIGVFLSLVCSKTGVWSFAGGNAKIGIWTAEA